MPALDIRELDDGDIEIVVDLWERCGLTRPWNDPRGDIAFACGNPNSTILVGSLNEKIIASVMVGHDGHRGTIYYLSVDPDEQGHGLGRQIMTAAEDWLRSRGVWKLNLIVRSENTAVIEFYAAVGYDREDRVNMAKWLDPERNPLT